MEDDKRENGVWANGLGGSKVEERAGAIRFAGLVLVLVLSDRSCSISGKFDARY